MRRTIVLSDSDVMFGDDYMFCEQSKLKIAVNTLRANNFADDIFKCILLNVNVLISIKISMKFIPKGPFNNIPALVQIMAWNAMNPVTLLISARRHMSVTAYEVTVCSTTFSS